MAHDADNRADSFEKFWRDSSFDRYNIRTFAAQQDLYNSQGKSLSILEYPGKPVTLPAPTTTVGRTARKRRSERQFSDKALSKRELGVLLSSFRATQGLEHRTFPSAGAAYSVEIFCVANNVTDFHHKLLYYNPDLHAVNVLGEAPLWESLAPKVNIATIGTPQCVILFVIFPERLTAKYRERGGRFALIEVGAAMQQLALQIARTKSLKGCAVGGTFDAFWIDLLGLTGDNAKLALAYICGK